jgi:hypothetical protein
MRRHNSIHVGSSSCFWALKHGSVVNVVPLHKAQTIVSLVRRQGPDLSARQLGVFLTSYLEEEAQTVRGLAAKLNVSKP